MSGRGRSVYGELMLRLYPTSLRSRIPRMHMRIAIIPMAHTGVSGARVEGRCGRWLFTDYC